MSTLGRRMLVVWLLAMVFQALLHADDTPALSPFVINPERQVNYTLGDLIEQRIKLHDDGYSFLMKENPPLRRVGPWVRRIRTDIDEQKLWLTMTYQIVNTPEISRWVSLPAVALVTMNNQSVNIQAWQFSVAPVIASPEPENTPVLQADILLPVRSTGALSRNKTMAALALLALLIAWISWWHWQNQRERRRLPFARCYEHAVKHRNSTVNDDKWRRLHRAFDDAAGQCINESNLDVLFARVPWLREMEAEITDFYRQSARHFYTLDSGTGSIDQHKLCSQLYKLERRSTKVALSRHSIVGNTR